MGDRGHWIAKQGKRGATTHKLKLLEATQIVTLSWGETKKLDVDTNESAAVRRMFYG